MKEVMISAHVLKLRSSPQIVKRNQQLPANRYIGANQIPLVTNQTSYNDRLRRREFPLYFPILSLVSELAFQSLEPAP